MSEKGCGIKKIWPNLGVQNIFVHVSQERWCHLKICTATLKDREIVNLQLELELIRLYLEHVKKPIGLCG